MKMRLFALAMLWCGVSLFAQDYFPKNDGVKSKNNNYTAFTNAKIYVTPTQIVTNGTLLIQNGKVVQVGKSVTIPKNSVIINLEGKSIYPSFIDIYSNFGIAKSKRPSGGGRGSQYGPTRDGFYWNDHIMPDANAINVFSYDDKKAKELREAGFGVVNTHIQDGVARGSGVLVALNGVGNDADRILDDTSAQHFSFRKSVTKRQSYPTSLMGAMSLLRQMHHDADWYAKGNVDTKDRSLEALLKNKGMVQIFEAKDKGHVLRADKIGDAFNTQYVIVAGGNEYENIADIKATNASFIVPINFPEAYDVSNPYQAGYVTVRDMRLWNQAPTNPKAMADNGITFSFTLHDLKSPSKFKSKLQKAIAHGLSETKALEALTSAPAQILGKSSKIGSLQTGRYANFLITSGAIFAKETVLYENWVQGNRTIVNNKDLRDIRGDYNLAVGNTSFKLSITGEPSKPKAKIMQDTIKLKSKLSYKDNWLDLSFSTDKGEKTYRLTGLTSANSKNLTGRLILPNGNESKYTARRTSEFSKKDKDEKDKEAPTVVAVTYPNVGYGNTVIPKQENILFKNATVWTSEAAGILENTDVLIKDGKISKIGKNLKAGRAKVIDATGKHLTAGIVDEHTHIAALSVNEAGHNSTAEVKMADVIDPEDIGIYRNLAGGVTTAQLLHGSANPIGGQSAIFKLKWGANANTMLYTNSPKFIKFALGENVKQSNWSGGRFPQTRMGVEQLYINYFQMAKEYDAKKKSGQPYRFDEEMETIAEIVNGERFITCHSYVQSEINMMIKVAEKFNFNINTFTHILEGYKVADKMKKHGVGGSTFSDWWAYKYEVNDAIPYNAAIMTSQGITVAINSDDGEMSRRLNQEAAKSVKYGGMSELEAWKMITINPATLLHINDKVGSIKIGKDADLVLWNGHPLSIYTKAEKTIIEGVTYFNLEDDKQKRIAVKKERNTLIQMMLKEKDGGKPTQSPKKSKKKLLHCDSL
ncbi:MAG: amidohydrolase family protein [Cellulophaga sp.]